MARSSSSLELLNRVLMPVPFVVLIVFCVRGLTLPGAMVGVSAFLLPDFSQLWSSEIWLVAIGQLFFGVSAGLGTLTTYASFNSAETPVVRSALIVCLSNSAFSLLSGLTVFSCAHRAFSRTP